VNTVVNKGEGRDRHLSSEGMDGMDEARIVETMAEAFPRLDMAVVHAVVQECQDRLDEASAALTLLSQAAEVEGNQAHRDGKTWDADEALARKIAAGKEDSEVKKPTMAEVLRNAETMKPKSKGRMLVTFQESPNAPPGATVCPCHGKLVRLYWPHWKRVKKKIRKEKIQDAVVKRPGNTPTKLPLHTTQRTNVTAEPESAIAILDKVDKEMMDALLEMFQDIGRETVLDVLVYFKGDLRKAMDKLTDVSFGQANVEMEEEDTKMQEEELNHLAEQFEFIEAVEQLLPHVTYDEIIDALKNFDYDTKHAYCFLERRGAKQGLGSSTAAFTDTSEDKARSDPFSQDPHDDQMAWKPSETRQRKMESLLAKYPSCDEELVQEVLLVCKGNFRSACAKLDQAGFSPEGKDNEAGPSGQQAEKLTEKQLVYKQYQKLPLEYFRNYCALMESSRKVGIQGHKARAQVLREKALLYRRLALEAREEAATHIFGQINTGSFVPIDLHGLHVREAIQTLGRELEIFKKSTTIIGAKVITGKGNRSGKGGPRLRPAVHDFLQAQGYHFYLDQGNDGCTVVEFKSKDRR